MVQPPTAHQVQTRVETHAQAYQGPVPPPDFLEGYERIVPGSAARLLRMAEDEATHRRALESKAQDSDIRERRDARIEARIGQFCGLAIGLAALGTGAFAAVSGAEWFGAIIGAGGIGGLIGVFVYGRRHPAPPPN